MNLLHRVPIHDLLLPSEKKLRQLLSEVLSTLFPEFELPDGIYLTLTDLSEDLFKLRLACPKDTATDDSQFICELYENVAYLFGKGFFDAPNDRSHQTMVWYITKDHWQSLMDAFPKHLASAQSVAIAKGRF